MLAGYHQHNITIITKNWSDAFISGALAQINRRKRFTRLSADMPTGKSSKYYNETHTHSEYACQIKAHKQASEETASLQHF